MTPQVTPSLDRKDLQDLRKLARMPILSYLQKQAQPPAPRPEAAKLQPARRPVLAAFTPSSLWKWITEYFGNRIGRKHPFKDYSAVNSDKGVYTLQGDNGEIRIALAGDWGTGTDEADHIAKLITAFQPHYAIHLGDVYYVGDQVEVDQNFLGIRNPPNNQFEPCYWPRGSHGTFALNGNHEMYARGDAYFKQMLPTLGPIVNGEAQGQRASFFCLENDYWRIIALDTGYNSIGLPVLENIPFFRPDCALRPELLAWIREAVRPRDDGRGIVLLSHHQYFSRFDDWYPTPAKQLAEFFSRPVLWFWGHEHLMAIYEEFGIDGGMRAFGRCVGHGGMPVDLPPQPKHPECRVEFVDTRLYPNDENLTIGFNGFVKMVLDANRLKVDYVDVHDDVVFSETWEVNNGSLTRVP